MKQSVLHLSADYPDLFQPNKTRAISGLVEGTADDFDHFVVSLNRMGGAQGWTNPGKILECREDVRGIAVLYAAPPAQITIARPMRNLVAGLIGKLDELGIRPDLVQGHKLTIEGVAARLLARELKVPYVLTLQGNTDQKLLRRRPDRSPLIGQVWHGARDIMALAPWTATWCESRLARRDTPARVIACALSHDAIIAPAATPLRLRTAFNLDQWRNKNVSTLLAAVRLLRDRGTTVELEIAGQGSDESRLAIVERTLQAGLQDQVSLVGHIEPERMQTWSNGATLFVLPSHRESFGMVFSEALLAGAPVIYPRGAAIEGFFPAASFARSVDADDVEALAQTMLEMIANIAAIKADLADSQARGELDVFRRDFVLARYREFLTQSLA
jgi:glycosyltransferase involved in cell wall biosynthesis